jgi:hypothetical protein
VSQDYQSYQAITNLNGCKQAAGFRWLLILSAVYLPALVWIFELSFNRLKMTGHYIAFPLVVCVLYLLGTAFSQYVSKKPVFPSTLDWTFPDPARS